MCSQNVTGIPKKGLDFLSDASGLSGAAPKVIQLRPAHVASPLHLDGTDNGAVCLEYTFDALAVRYFSNGKRRVQATISFCDHDSLKCLQSLARSFLYLYLNNNRIAW